jgi:hypothetical protein
LVICFREDDPTILKTTAASMGELDMKHCAICGKPCETTTRDHIPPKGLFGKPLPDNLLTVPSCQQCNQEASGDDEYFRLLAVEWDASRIGDGVGVGRFTDR